MSRAKGKKKLNPEELKILDEKEMYACKVWGLENKLGVLKSFGIREKRYV